MSCFNEDERSSQEESDSEEKDLVDSKESKISPYHFKGVFNLEEVGEPFSPTGSLQRQSSQEGVLPSSVYSAIILVSLRLDKIPMPQHSLIFSVMIAWAVSLFCESVFAYYLFYSVDQELVHECDGSASLLQWVALPIWVAVMLHEFAEAFETYQWLSCFPVASTNEPLRLREFKHPDPVARIQGRTVFNPVSSITCSMKVYLYIVGIVPQVIIATAVLVAGAGAILRSASDFDLILNSLAATFVAELDNLAYKILLPYTIQHYKAEFPPLKVRKGGVGIFLFYDVGMLLVTSGVACALYFGVWCRKE